MRDLQAILDYKDRLILYYPAAGDITSDYYFLNEDDWLSRNIDVRNTYPDEEILDDNHSLSFLYSFLDRLQYKRGGRDYIVNREIVKGYKPQADGNILLHLNYPFEERLYVSKGQTEEFIKWLRR